MVKALQIICVVNKLKNDWTDYKNSFTIRILHCNIGHKINIYTCQAKTGPLVNNHLKTKGWRRNIEVVLILKFTSCVLARAIPQWLAVLSSVVELAVRVVPRPVLRYGAHGRLQRQIAAYGRPRRVVRHDAAVDVRFSVEEERRHGYIHLRKEI